MKISDKIFRYVTIALIVLLVILAIKSAADKHGHEQAMAELRNEIASQSQTIEMQEKTYTKLSFETDKWKFLAESRGREVQDLYSELEKRKEEILTANQVAVKWKKAYEDAAKANQSDVPDPADPSIVRKKVEFEKDFGMIGVTGWTLTDPAEAWVKVEQLKPLELTLIVTQDKDKKWHSYVTSSDENTDVQINVSAVNPHMMSPKWYEHLQLNTSLAVGTTGDGAGVLAGLGLSYRIKQFDVGPTVFLGISDRVDRYVGATFTWRPFQRD